MPEEAEPFLSAAQEVGNARPGPAPHSTLRDLRLEDTAGQLLVTGIGTVASAASLSAVLASGTRPDLIISVGSAGGLHSDVEVGDVVVGTEYCYGDVDARAFGYEFGQVPGAPARFAAVPVAALPEAPYVRAGLLLTSASFVAGELATELRERFPTALAVDMESVALAHTCHLYGVPGVVSIRGISDLCTPRAGEEFHDGLGLAAGRSAEITRTLISGLRRPDPVLP